MEIDGMEFEDTVGSGETKYYKPDQLPTGKNFLVGKFVGTFEDQFGHTNYKLLTKEGITAVLNHCGSLAHKMQAVNQGDWVAVQYLGKQKLEKGKFKGRDFHAVDVKVSHQKMEENKSDEIPF